MDQVPLHLLYDAQPLLLFYFQFPQFPLLLPVQDAPQLLKLDLDPVSLRLLLILPGFPLVLDKSF